MPSNNYFDRRLLVAETRTFLIINGD